MTLIFLRITLRLDQIVLLRRIRFRRQLARGLHYALNHNQRLILDRLFHSFFLRGHALLHLLLHCLILHLSRLFQVRVRLLSETYRLDLHDLLQLLVALGLERNLI